MNSQAQQLYIRTQVNTASPGELTLMLFNGCIKYMKQALEGIERKDYASKNLNIKKSQDILDELLITLNMEYEISKNLSALYMFMKEKLFEVNVRLNKDSLQVCIDLLSELRDAWAEAVKSLKHAQKAQA